jgi:hypothetical protein
VHVEGKIMVEDVDLVDPLLFRKIRKKGLNCVEIERSAARTLKIREQFDPDWRVWVPAQPEIARLVRAALTDCGKRCRAKHRYEPNRNAVSCCHVDFSLFAALVRTTFACGTRIDLFQLRHSPNQEEFIQVTF